MAIPTDVNISGLRELIDQFDKLSKFADTGEMEEKLLGRARELRNDIRRNAPRSNKWSGSVDVKPGNLRKSIESRKFRKKVPNSPAVYVRSSKKKAPHAHLVEYGTMNFRFPKHKKVLHFIYEGEEVFVKKVAPMPPHPFFRPTVDSKKGEIESNIAKDTEALIMKIANER
ncbi:MAG: HK97-gp10 family putative phage morphogenesis protein [Nitrosarchaeum sp.]